VDRRYGLEGWRSLNYIMSLSLGMRLISINRRISNYLESTILTLFPTYLDNFLTITSCIVLATTVDVKVVSPLIAVHKDPIFFFMFSCCRLPPFRKFTFTLSSFENIGIFRVLHHILYQFVVIAKVKVFSHITTNEVLQIMRSIDQCIYLLCTIMCQFV